MTSGKFIKWKLQAWAVWKLIRLQGSKGERGESNYTLSVVHNIFKDAPLSDSVRDAFKVGVGGELNGKIPTMFALHSSAALAVNLFQYWVLNGDLTSLARLLKVPSRGIATAKFEDKFSVCADPQSHGFPKPSYFDFVFRYSDGRCVGVECKLFESYGWLDHKPLRQAYLALSDAWRDIPACRALVE